MGNSLAIRIPSTTAKDAGLADGDQLELKINKLNQIVIRPARPRYKFSELLAKVTLENRHGETDWGPPVGNELVSRSVVPGLGDFIWLNFDRRWAANKPGGVRPSG